MERRRAQRARCRGRGGWGPRAARLCRPCRGAFSFAGGITKHGTHAASRVSRRCAVTRLACASRQACRPLSACGSARPAVCLPPGITRSAASSSGCLTQGRTHQQNPRGASGVRPGRLRYRQEVGDSFSRVCWQSHTCPLPWVLLSPSLSGAGEGGRLGAPRDCSPPSQQPTGPRVQLPAPDILARPPAVCPHANRPTPLSPGFCLRKWES